MSVREQAALVVDRLRRSGTMTFRALCGDSPDTLTTVARFLSLLELFREGAVAFDQVTPLGELTVRWTGGDDGPRSRSPTSSRARRRAAAEPTADEPAEPDETHDHRDEPTRTTETDRTTEDETLDGRRSPSCARRWRRC